MANKKDFIIDNSSLKSIGSTWSLVLHDNEVNLFKSSRYIMNRLMCSRDMCPQFFACCYHNLDLNDDKEMEAPHYQCAISFKDSYSKKTILDFICDLFHCNVNQVGLDKSVNLPRLCRYLLHRGWPNKHQYDYGDIVTNDKDTYDMYYNLTDIRDQFDCISIVEEYHYDLKSIILHVSNYKDYRTLIKDLIQDNRFKGRF